MKSLVHGEAAASGRQMPSVPRTILVDQDPHSLDTWSFAGPFQQEADKRCTAMSCTQCGRENRAGAAFCDGCGAALTEVLAAGLGFVGRRDELRGLQEALSRVRQGTGCLLLVGGEPGIGKTRLAHEAAARAANMEFQALWGRCLEDSSAPPYWPWLQLGRAWLETASDDQIASAVDSDAGLLLDLLPEIEQRLPRVDRVKPLRAPTEARFRLFEAIVRVWLRVARHQPLMLVLENLHAADPVSLRLLEFLAPEISKAPLLVLGTYRETEVSPHHPFSRALGEAARLPHCQRLRLQGLSRSETDRLLRNLTGERTLPRNLTRAVHAHSEGNPLFIRELAHSLAQRSALPSEGVPGEAGVHIPIPEGIREVIRQRLTGLSERCTDLLTRAAVIGRAFELELLIGLTGESAITTVLDTLEEALSARLIEERAQPGRYQFTHALIRETLYEELPATRRLSLHRRIGEFLVVQHGEDSTSHLPRLAHHFAQAAPLGTAAQAMTYATRAGERADELLAYEEAARLYALALELQSRFGEDDGEGECRLLLALGTAQYKAGDYVEAMTTFQSAATNARLRHAAQDLASAALGYEEASWRPGLPGRTACQLLANAVAAVGVEDSPLRAKLLSALTRALIFTGDVERSAKVQANAVAVARRVGDPGILAAALGAGLSARWQPELLQQRLNAAREAATLAEQADDWEMTFHALSWMMFDLLESGDMSAMRGTLAYHTQLAEELGQPFYRYIGVSIRAALALSEGQFDLSEQYAREALVLGQRQRLDAFGVFSVQMFSIERERGRLGSVAPLLERFLANAPNSAVWRPGLAVLYCELGRLEAARAEFDKLAEGDFAALPRDGLWVTCLAYLAEICAALDDAERAAALYRYLLPYSGRNVVAGTTVACYGAADRFLGKLAAVFHDHEAASRHFEAALALNQQTGARTWLAHTQYDCAVFHLGSSDPLRAARARSLLAECRQSARQLGMAALSEKVDRLSRHARLPMDADANRIGLSRRELEVLRLLAAGHSNREIAGTLFVSPNTVANHVRNILAKTGTNNRTEAAAYARRLNLLEA